MHSYRISRPYFAWPPSKRKRALINARQDMIDGYSLESWQQARVWQIGLSGIGLPVAEGLTKKGVRWLEGFDDDLVELSNLSRMNYRVTDDGKHKAYLAGKRLTKAALHPHTFLAHPFRFQEKYTLDRPPKKRPDLIICSVDNNPTRQFVARYAHRYQIPLIVAAISTDGNSLYVFVQEPGQACWGCAFPEFLSDTTYPCQLPGIGDVLNVVSGLVLHASDSIICTRPREWNRRFLYLDGGLSDRTEVVERRPDCPVCSEVHLLATGECQ